MCSTVHIYLGACLGTPGGWRLPHDPGLARGAGTVGGIGGWGDLGDLGTDVGDEIRQSGPLVGRGHPAHWSLPPCLAAQLAACRSDYDPMGHPRRPPPPWLLRAAKLYIVRSTYVASHRIHTRWVGPTPAGFSPDAYCDPFSDSRVLLESEAFERRWYRCLRLDCLLYERIWAIGCGGTQSLPGT